MSESQEILTTTVSAQDFLAAVIVLVVVPSLLVIVRVANNYHHAKGLFLDDYFSVVAIAFLATTGALYYVMRTMLTDPTVSFTYIGRLTTAVGFMAVFAVYFAKVPILLLYIRIFGLHSVVRITSWILLIVPLVMFVGGAIYGATVCSPENRVADMVFLQGCIQPSLHIGVWNGSISAVVDIILFILPLPVIAKLQLPPHKRFGLMMVFLAGFFGIVASCVTLYFRGISLAGRGSSGAEVGQMLGQIVESSIAIMVGCVPALRSFWSNHIIHMPIYSRIQSAFTATRSKRSQTSIGSKAPPGTSSEHINSAHNYVQLNEVKITERTEVVSSVPAADVYNRGW
ncbi:hypothetical protein MMYC01_206627 [Madurella mycetomatis]|uniref:Rhodopsin domain-containing protein n=1 Tax=Madurella mycetomatis TaxID=100816 RepID=A0A175VWC1_9PEZI|nr:hypothetical protein MMYC01_206627 [Madurella mycetomatis]